VEFFIEGTRSRSGKLLPARLGVLGMVMDASAEIREGTEVTILPMSISYEQIAEERSYARELAGEAKKKEDIGELARASKVVTRRYGRVYLRVGEPLPLKPLLASLPAPWSELDRDHRHEVLQGVGEQVMHRIARSMVLLPSGVVAMALLASARRGIRRVDLHARVERMLALLTHEGAPQAVTLGATGWAIDQALRRFQAGRLVSRLDDEDGEILQVIDARRITLEYYKNGAMHLAVPASLLAGAVSARCLPTPEQPVARGTPDDAEVSRLFRLQIFLLRYEFTLDPAAGVEAHEAAARAALIRYGALVEREGRVELGDARLLAELAGLTRNFVESYLLVLRGARTLRSRDIPADDLPRRIQVVGRGLLAVDQIRRPEALSLENLKNAVRAFREEGVLQIKAGGAGLQFEEGPHRQYTADLMALLGQTPLADEAT
jgi:glycerol-3-phosphate O-acyltransferase